MFNCHFIHSWELWFISAHDLKPQQQIFPTDGNANFPCDNYFLHQIFQLLQLENEQIR